MFHPKLRLGKFISELNVCISYEYRMILLCDYLCSIKIFTSILLLILKKNGEGKVYWSFEIIFHYRFVSEYVQRLILRFSRLQLCGVTFCNFCINRYIMVAKYYFRSLLKLVIKKFTNF